MKKGVKETVVLLVEDNPASIGMAVAALEQEGFFVSVATTGEKALERFENLIPDIILLDVLLPGIDGYETCRRLKASEKTSAIPVIFMSALLESFDKVKAFEAGAVDYITKPIDAREMLARVRTHLSIQQMQKELRAAKEQAESANRTKSRFLAHMSHELRSPLQGILGFAELMGTYPDLPPRLRRDVDGIYNSGEHLLKLINDLLEMAKIEAGHMKVEKEDFNLPATIRFVQEMFSASAKKKGVELITRISSDIPEAVHSDPSKIRQVLINLLGNAVKFTEQGKIILTVDPYNRPSAAGDQTRSPGPVLLIFRISDTGPGIAEDEMETLFEPFRQTRSGREKGGGTGLGLAICRNFVEMLDGEISVKSQEGKGTVFQFILPAEPARIFEAPVQPAKQNTPSFPSPIPEKCILVVDDDPGTRLILRKYIEQIEQGEYSVKEAINGLDALAQYMAFQPHLIWMDLTMPELDGYQAIKEIRYMEKQGNGNGGRVPAIAHSASDFSNQREEVLISGFDDFLIKPFRKDDVLQLTQKYLGPCQQA